MQIAIGGPRLGDLIDPLPPFLECRDGAKCAPLPAIPRGPRMALMAKQDGTWNVLPHHPIEKLSSNLWRVEGDLKDMPLKRVMTLAKRTDGSLVVHNAISLEDSAMAEIDDFGKVAYVIVPNGFHRLDATAYRTRYPDAKFFAPSGAREKVEEVVDVHGVCEDFPADESVSYATLEGTGSGEGVLTVTSDEEVTLVLNDVVFNMPHVTGIKGFVLRYVTASTGGPRVSRVGKLFLVKDKAALREHLNRLADTPRLRRIIVSHHETIETDPAGTLRRVADAL